MGIGFYQWRNCHFQQDYHYPLCYPALDCSLMLRCVLIRISSMLLQRLGCVLAKQVALPTWKSHPQTAQASLVILICWKQGDRSMGSARFSYRLSPTTVSPSRQRLIRDFILPWPTWGEKREETIWGGHAALHISMRQLHSYRKSQIKCCYWIFKCTVVGNYLL